jgi:hypothetical protein
MAGNGQRHVALFSADFLKLNFQLKTNVIMKTEHDLPQDEALNKTAVSGSASPMFDWNKLSIDQMVEHLRQKYMFSSSGDAKCIYHLIEFYDKHK